MSIEKIIENSKFDPGISGVQTHFGFIKAELDKDFIWTMSLKFDSLPPKVAMRYALHFYLDPEPTQDSIRGVVSRLQEKQLELGVDVKEKEDQAKEQILELKRRYDEESSTMGVHTFDVATLEFKNKIAGKESKVLTSMKSISKIQELNLNMFLERMVVSLDVIPDDDEMVI